MSGRVAEVKAPGRRAIRRSHDIFPEDGQTIEEHHLVAAHKWSAHLVVTYGEVYMPIFERIEHELALFRQKRRPVDRARAVVEGYTLDGGLKAIR